MRLVLVSSSLTIVLFIICHLLCVLHVYLYIIIYIYKKKNTVTVNEVLFRPSETTVIHAGKNEEPQTDTGNSSFSICTGNGQSQSTKIVLKRKNF